VIDRLTKEGLIGLNKSLALPLVPQRIAVISSPTAAGYGDFFEHLDRNPYGYSFSHVLFPALMQGAGAEDSIIAAIRKVGLKKDLFDLLVIIRGGGQQLIFIALTVTALPLKLQGCLYLLSPGSPRKG